MVADAAAQQAIASALRPVGLTERAQLWVTKGWTAAQVYQRLPPTMQATLAERHAQDGRRRAVDAVYNVLILLAREGKVQRKQVRYTMDLNTKGPRDMLVDVFRAR